MNKTSSQDIINEDKLLSILENNQDPHSDAFEAVLKKAQLKKGLSLEETAILLGTSDQILLEKLFKTARQIKNDIYGERLVLFAPFYISDYCVNDCDYCAFHVRNKIIRKKLNQQEIREQVTILENMGHKRLLLEFGEHPAENPIDYVVESIKTIYNTKTDSGEIRRVNVNIAATSVEDYRKLKEVGIGTYQLFQETYHRETYKNVHHGPKADYNRQLLAHDRAFTAGLDDLGIGALFGLYDYKFEVLALLAHAQYLDKTYGVGPHTISVPRIQPANTVDLDLPHEASESDLLKIIAILRLAVPYTGMILSTRESEATRKQAFELGISQASAGSVTTTGGYSDKEDHNATTGQFSTADHRSLDKVILGILNQGLLPSFCTACYRKGRTGEAFMDIAKPGEIHNLCRPNGILTFKEYLEDFASAETKLKGELIIKKFLRQIPNENIKNETTAKLAHISKGKRDLYF
ncbi:[FeFe] hydrogenase H-cluster radical SAM maturase HydG [Patescibacteria group bacterium]|nr:[FeFe] hydrogenase H-cluster radical SAM maturase HydG [Patescibacteria group bacterium]